MKKTVLFLVGLLNIPIVYSAQISVDEAKVTAEKFSNKTSIQYALGVNVNRKDNLTFAYAANNDKVAGAFYVFNKKDNAGYIIVAGDDCLPEVLGYADTGTFDINIIPDNMKWWLSEYQREIKYIQSNADNIKLPIQKTYSTSVDPLLGQIMWDQSEPYNNLCPTYQSGKKTNRCVTGCVATAMAQVMGYHQWPTTGTGSYSYSATINEVKNAKTLTANFGETTYDWANIKPYYNSANSTAENAAIATLMYHCGVSVDMEYGESSGAPSFYVPIALTSYFKYAKTAIYRDRNNYTATEWDEMIHKELDEGRPVYYAGDASDGGHAFVFDGYNNDGYYHLNWGWGGMSNGYFRSLGLNPDSQGTGSFEGGYNQAQEMITGIMPDTESDEVIPYMTITKFTAPTGSISLGSKFQIPCIDVYNEGNSSFTGTIYSELYDSDGNSVSKTGKAINDLGVGYGWNKLSLSASVPATLTDGEYKLKFTQQTSGSTTYYPVCTNRKNAQYLNVKIQGTTVTVSLPEIGTANLEQTNITTNHGLYIKAQTLATATIKNTGTDYYGKVYLALLKEQENTSVLVSDAAMAQVDNDATIDVPFTLTVPESVTAGNYRLAVLDEESNIIGGNPIDVTVEAAQADANLSIVSQLAPVYTMMSANDIRAAITVKNNGGIYNGMLQAFIMKQGNNNISGFLQSDYVGIANGETKTITLTGATTDFSKGDVVYIQMRDPMYPSDYYLWGDQTSFTLDDILTEVSTITGARNALYPNPAAYAINVENVSAISTIGIYSLSGSIVKDVVVNDDTHTATIDVSALPSGSYIVKVSAIDGSVTTHNMIKK